MLYMVRDRRAGTERRSQPQAKTALLVAKNEHCLDPVFGVPAIRRLVLLARRLGYGEVHVLAHGEPVAPVLHDLVSSQAIHQDADGSSFDALAAGLRLQPDDEVLVMSADRVIDAWSLTQLIDGQDGTCGNGAATGICTVRASTLPAALEAICCSGPCEAEAHAAPSLPVCLAATSVKKAESVLTSSLRRATAEHEYGFISRHFGRALSRPLSTRLAKTGASPNAITFGNILIGLTGAYFLAKGGYRFQLLGSLLFLSSVILDGVDGEVARLKLRQTAFGHYLDIVGDNVVHTAVFIGIALGLYHQRGSVTYLNALWFLLGGFGLCACAVQRLIGHAPDQPSVSEVSRFTALFVNRDFAYLVVLLAVVDRIDWFLFGASLGVYLFAFLAFFISMRGRKTKEKRNNGPTAQGGRQRVRAAMTNRPDGAATFYREKEIGHERPNGS